MKHSRLMALVDTEPVKPEPIKLTNNNNNNDPLTKAITSLASSNEFSRTNYGSSALAIDQLDKELNEILDRTDIGPADKLKLYSQRLQRYLFLQRTATQQQQPTTINAISPPHTHSSPLWSPTLESDSDTPFAQSTLLPSAINKSLEKPRIKSNLPRLTPPEARLRKANERRKNTRYIDYFSNWESYNQDADDDEE